MFGFERLKSRISGGRPFETRVIVIGATHRRAYVKDVLSGSARVVGELASAKRAAMIPELSPDVVILDCDAEDINPLAVLPSLSQLEGQPRIVAVTEARDPHLPRSLGQSATVTIPDAESLEHAVLDIASVHCAPIAA